MASKKIIRRVLALLLIMGLLSFLIYSIFQVIHQRKIKKEATELAQEISRRESLFSNYSNQSRLTLKVDQDAYTNAVLNNSLFRSNIILTQASISKGEHFWVLINRHELNIHTLLGCNPWLESLHARVGDTLILPNTLGNFHFSGSNETVGTLLKLYDQDKSNLAMYNHLPETGLLNYSEVLFIPRRYPRQLSEALIKQYENRDLFSVPTDGWVRGRGFGWQMHPILKVPKLHKGIDLTTSKGTPVYAARKGTVYFAGESGGYGNLIILKHDTGFETRYAHLSKIYVRSGQKVSHTKIIGAVGSTGLSTRPHLHFEVRIYGKPVNPMRYLW